MHIRDEVKRFLLALDNAGGDADPQALGPLIPTAFGKIRNEPHEWVFLHELGWVVATPAPTDRFSDDWPERVVITSKGRDKVRDFRAEIEEQEERRKKNKLLDDLVDKLNARYPTAQLTVGYLGNYSQHGDDTSWYVFSKLSRPGSYGHKSWSWGGFPGDKGGPALLWDWAKVNLEGAVEKAVNENDGPYKGPRPQFGVMASRVASAWSQQKRITTTA